MQHQVETRHVEATSNVGVSRRRAQVSEFGRARPRPSGVDSADVELLQESFGKAEPIATTVADLFYERLFALLPESRAMFPDDLRLQKRKLIGALRFVVHNLRTPPTLRLVLEDLGRRHDAYGVTARHYEVAGVALLHALEQGLGGAWNERLERAWTKAYLLVVDTMSGADDTPTAKA